MTALRAGLTAEQITRFEITGEELADLARNQPTPKGHTMPRTTLPANSTHQERLASLPPLAGAAGNPAYETRLERLANIALDTLGELDAALEDLADEFAARFHADDERTAVRGRIAAAAKTHRAAARR